jgi:hypothetical protein
MPAISRPEDPAGLPVLPLSLIIVPTTLPVCIRRHGQPPLTSRLHCVRRRRNVLQSRTVDIPPSLKDSLRKFRFAKRNAGSAAIVVRVNKQTLCMEEVETFDSISLEDLAEGTRSRHFTPRSRKYIYSIRAPGECPALCRPLV